MYLTAQDIEMIDYLSSTCRDEEYDREQLKRMKWLTKSGALTREGVEFEAKATRLGVIETSLL